MNTTRLRILALGLLLATGSGILAAQAIPDSPAPAPFPDPAWSRLQTLTDGRPIIVTLDDSRSLHCLFGGVTDAYLFCNPIGNPPGVGFRFNHAEVIGVDLDRSTQQSGQAAPHEHNYHPAWISSMIAGGVIVGLVASHNHDAGYAAKAGIIGAGIVGAIGAPFAFLPHPPMALPGPAYPPYLYGAQVRIPVRIRIHN